MVDARYPAFQYGPKALYGVRVNVVARHVDFFGVVYPTVPVALLVQVVIHAVLVCIYGGFGQYLFLNLRHDCGAFGIGNCGSYYPALAFGHTENGGLMRLFTRTPTLPATTTPAHIGFVSLYRAG